MAYVYKISFADGTYYFGVRYAKCAANPWLDTAYTSSSKLVNARIAEGEQYTKSILYVGLSKEIAMELEASLLKAHYKLQNCLNKCQNKAIGFDWSGKQKSEQFKAYRSKAWKENNPMHNPAILQSMFNTKANNGPYANPMQGKKHSAHSRQKMSNSRAGKRVVKTIVWQRAKYADYEDLYYSLRLCKTIRCAYKYLPKAKHINAKPLATLMWYSKSGLSFDKYLKGASIA